VWDPGTTVDGNVAERYQVLYATEPTAATLYTLPAKPTAGDGDMNVGLARAWTLSTALGPYTPDLVSFRNEWFLLSGSARNHWMNRGTAGQAAGAHGMPENSTVMVETHTSGTGDASADAADISVWFTWYDSTNDIEGAAASASVRNYLVAAGTTTSRTQLRVVKSVFDAARPPEADSIRVYVGRDVASVDGTAYPIGGLIETVAISDLTETTAPRGVPPVTTTVYLLPVSIAIPADIDPSVYSAYPLVTIEGVPISRNMEPPASTTGDVYEESLVLNDIDDPRKVWFSFPGEPHAFPTLFFINFETKEADEVIAIRTLGARLGVYLASSVWRVNWLPRESDFSFNRGRVKDVVCEGRGIVARDAVTTFTHPALGPVHAFVSQTGIYVTDLVEPPMKITSHLDWNAVLASGPLSSAILVDDPDKERLVLRLGNSLFYLHYDPAHVMEGALAVTGPIPRPGGVGGLSLVTTENSTHVLVSTDNNGTNGMYYEATGFTDPASSVPLVWDVETREIYPFGVGEEGKTENFLLHLKPSNFGVGSWYGQLVARTVDGERVLFTDPIILTGRTLKTTTMSRLFESYSIRLSGTSTAAAMGVNVAGVRVDSLGEAESK